MKIKKLSMDDLSIFSYFSVPSIILLFSVGYILGELGFVIVSILLTAGTYFVVVWGKNLGRSFANAPADRNKVAKEATVIALACLSYSVYLSLGLHELVLYLKQDDSLGLTFFLWAISIIMPVMFWTLLASYRWYKDR